MDGNVRWSRGKNISIKEGYKKGLFKIKEIIDVCIENKVKYLTLFALSSENIKRSNIHIIFDVMTNHFDDLINNITQENKVAIKIIGRRNNLPSNINKILDNLETLTKNNHKLKLNIAFNYGSISEFIYSINKIIKLNKKKEIIVNEKLIRDNLYLPNVVDPDILIRTGGFQRLSNFFLFQLSYTELFFTDTLWPDITKKEINNIFEKFKIIKRKHGL